VLDLLHSYEMRGEDLVGVTTDNASSALNASAFISGGKCAMIRCAAHTLNLCGQQAAIQQSFDEALKSMVQTINFFGSQKRLEVLAAKQKETETKELRFILVSDTRWNYTTDVVRRACKNKDAVELVQPLDLDLRGEAAAEWTNLRERFANGVRALEPVLPLLEHFSNSMQTLSSADSITISRTIRCAWNLWEHADKFASSNSIAARDFARVLRDEIDERFFYEPTPWLIRAAEVLDPVVVFDVRLGHVESAPGANDGDLRQMRDDIANEIFPPTNDQAQALDFFGDTVGPTSNNAIFRNEFGLYLSAVRVSPQVEDTFEWWRANADKWPRVAFAARSLLSPSATSSETERLFSTGAYVVNKWRNRLTGPRAGALIFLSKAVRRVTLAVESENDSSDAAAAGVEHDFE
jgi:hypothetical protein